MVTSNSKCILRGQTLIGVLITAVFILTALITSGILTKPQSAVASSYIVVLAVFGIVSMLKDISILRCPNEVLIGATVFVAITSLIDAYLI